jgi:hypothetical protein
VNDDQGDSEGHAKRQPLIWEERFALLTLRRLRVIRARKRATLPYMMLFSRGFAVFEVIDDAIDFRLTHRGEIVAEAVAPVARP